MTITWYYESKTLLFQGSSGTTLKTRILESLGCIASDNNLNICESLLLNQGSNGMPDRQEINNCLQTQSQSVNPSECTECRRLALEMAEVKLDLEILRVTFNQFCESMKDTTQSKKVIESREVASQTMSESSLILANEKHNLEETPVDLEGRSSKDLCALGSDESPHLDTNGALAEPSKPNCQQQSQQSLQEIYPSSPCETENDNLKSLEIQLNEYREKQKAMQNSLQETYSNPPCRTENDDNPNSLEVQLNEYREKQDALYEQLGVPSELAGNEEFKFSMHENGDRNKNFIAGAQKSTQVLILGDSSTKKLNPEILSKASRTKVSCQSAWLGKTRHDLNRLNKNINQRKPRVLIIQARVDNISSESVANLTKRTTDLVMQARRLLPTAKITVSSAIINRLAGIAIPIVNQNLRHFCRTHGLDFVDNCNIPGSCFSDSDSKFLNGRGSLMLENNLCKYLQRQSI